MRESLERFVQAMDRELAANDHKPGWQRDKTLDLLERLREEVDELEDAIVTGLMADEQSCSNDLDVEKEAADVANFAMMIADNARRMTQVEPTSRASCRALGCAKVAMPGQDYCARHLMTF